MRIPFVKMHGLGNDFILLDFRKRSIASLPKFIRRVSDRRLGIGFDQALVLRTSRKADFRMDIYNPDGGRAEMCGNGIRCLASYIWAKKISSKLVLSIDTLAGVILTERSGKEVSVDMGPPVLEGRRVPVRADGVVLARPLRVDGRGFKVTCVSMGNPHAVIFVSNVDSFDVPRFGPSIETNRFFPNGTNVEFVEVLSRRRLKMRVWERGAGETPACGTGASAAMVAARMHGLVDSSVMVNLKHGSLKVEWDGGVDKKARVYMTGPAVKVYSGELEI
jgi:diaminopimelate epimerase